MTDQVTQDAAEVPKHRLPPLDIRPFQPQDVIQVRQLIADSKFPESNEANKTQISYNSHVWLT